MATPDKNLDDILKGGRPASKPEPGSKTDDPDDNGPCAARLKDKWITALTIQHHNKAWESFQYTGIGTHSTFTPERFEVIFVGHDAKWRLTAEGRNLWTIYNGIIQHRIEWLKAADRDFGPEAAPYIKSIEVTEVREEPGAR